MKKPILTLFLAIVASVGTIFSTSVTVDGILYDLYVDSPNTSPYYHATVKPNTNYSGDLVIQSSVSYSGHSYSVDAIWHKAFMNCTGITSIIIPSSVKNIYDQAFDGCTGITSIDIPNSVTYIGYNAFGKIPNINFKGSASGSMGQSSPWGALNVNKYAEAPIVYNDATKTKILRCATSATGDLFIPNSVKIIGEEAFLNCSNLNSVHIPSSVAEIKDNAFLECSNTIVYTNTPFVKCGEYAFGLDNEVTIQADIEIKNDTDIVLCNKNDIALTFTVIEDGSLIDKTFSETGDYPFTSIANTPAIVHVVSNRHFIQLPDTTICAGEWIFDGEPLSRYNYLDSDDAPCNWNKDEWMKLGYDPFPQNEYGEYDETLYELFSSWFYEHIHYDAASLPSGVTTYQTIFTNGQRFYSSGTYTKTYTNSQGCDSVVTRNVIVSKAAAPKVIVSPEQDNPNSGSIKLYNKYCTGSEYNEGQYKYYYNNAEYDYFTINGTKYEFSSAIEGEYNEYYHPDGIRVIDEPSHIIENLSAGDYHIVFFTSCDSVVEDVKIEGYAMEIDGVYYTYQEAYHRYDGYPYEAGAVVTYRGASPEAYDEYSGEIIIPESIIWNGSEIPVLYIDPYAFASSKNITTITFKSPVPPICNNVLFTSVTELIHYVPFGSLDAYKQRFGKHWCYYVSGGYTALDSEIHVIKPSQICVTGHATSATITVGNEKIQKHIASCGIMDGEEFGGNIIEYTGLTPNSTYSNVPFYIKTIEGDSDAIALSFSTTALELTTQECKPVSANAAILLAQTNMSDSELSCGFEWKRNDAPSDMAGNKVYCPVANGTMAGRLKNLNDQVYYKYRAFYESAVGKMYYGDWKYIFTGDNAVEFDPILYTYAATAVTEHEATLKGYALEGAEDFTEQGFEYWAESRVKNNKPGLRFKAQLGEKQTVTATGISMKVTLTDLDQGTTYKYRTFAKIGNDTIRGSVMSFTTQGEWVAYTVTFLDKDGNIISTQQIEPGDDAVAPEAPEVEGFRFTGWDTEYTNVQSDLTIHAQYAEIVMVTLVVKSADEEMGTVKGGGEYAEGIKVKITAIPNEGYEFVMWNDGNTDNPRTVTAANKTYTAVFDKKSSGGDDDSDEAIGEVFESSDSEILKFVRNGQLYILRNGEIFNAQGARVE